jgi:hypothetical protein
MSTELQIKPLRVLETRTFRLVGGNEELKVNTRILSSTNRDLQEAIRAEAAGLSYYRLNVFPLGFRLCATARKTSRLWRSISRAHRGGHGVRRSRPTRSRRCLIIPGPAMFANAT